MELLRENHALARKLLRRSIVLSREMGHAENLCFALTKLGLAASKNPRARRVNVVFEEALGLANRMNHPWYISVAQNDWGEYLLTYGDSNSARTAFKQALTTAQKAELPEQMANARFGLARVAAALGDTNQARRWASEALAVFQRIGHRRERQVAEYLKML